MSRPDSLPVMLCQGDPEEMGFQQGVAAKTAIASLMDDCANLEQFRVGWPNWLPNWLYLCLARLKGRWLLGSSLPRDYPNMSERLHGLATGSGAGKGIIYMANCAEAIVSQVHNRVVVPVAGCSAIAVRDTRSHSGEPMIARNFDYVPQLRPYLTLRESRPRGLYRSLEFTAVALGGAIDGINEKGLSITYNYAFTTDHGKSTGTIAMLISETLGCCETVAEAAAWMQSRPRWGGSLLMLADATGDIASLEISANHAVLRRPEPGSDLIFHTNRYSSKEMRQVEVHERATFTNPPLVRGQLVHASAEERYQRLTELTGSHDKLSSEILHKILSDHGPTRAGSQNTVCMHSANSSTSATIQYFPRQRKIRVAMSPACQSEMIEIGF